MYIESSSSDKGCGYTQDEYHSNYVVPALESFLLYLHEYNVEIVSICANDTYCFEYDEDSGEVIEVY